MRSYDQGQTWQAADDGFRTRGRGLGHGVHSFTLGPDRKLYAATDSLLWRTVDPLPVADEGAPADTDALGVTVYPNPTSEKAAVRVMLPAPGTIRVEVFDAAGRQMASLYDGDAVGGTTMDLDTSGLAAGVYRVVVTAGGRRVSAALTVAR